MATTMSALGRTMAGFESSRVVLEVGTHSPWVSRLVEQAGHEVIIANPRRVRLIAENDSKTDEVDAELLARLGRVDPGLLKPIVHRGERAQHDRILLLARDGLVRSRTQLVNQVRGFAKSLGHRMPSSSTEAFPRRVREQFSKDLFPGQSVMLEMIDRLTQEIRRMDREAEKLCNDRYPETGVLRQVKGVGALTALGFVDAGRPEPIREKPDGRGVSWPSAPLEEVGRAATSAADHQGGRCALAPLLGGCVAVHPRAIWSRHGASSLRSEARGTRRQSREEACGGCRGAQALGASAPLAGDRRGISSDRLRTADAGGCVAS